MLDLLYRFLKYYDPPPVEVSEKEIMEECYLQVIRERKAQ